LPRIGYLTKGSEEKFFERLDELLVISKNALEQRRKACQHLYDIGLFPYTKRYLTQGFANHFSTIAINGMNECVLNFMGKTIDDEEAKNFALKVQDYILNRCSDFQEETGNLFNFEASPAESVSYRFFKHDRKQYPNILSMSDVPQKISSEKEEF
jgi:ribonucleoside-triphosphate reductase